MLLLFLSCFFSYALPDINSDNYLYYACAERQSKLLIHENFIMKITFSSKIWQAMNISFKILENFRHSVYVYDAY